MARQARGPAAYANVRLKLDENITVVAAAPLLALGYDVDTVGDEGLAGHADPEVLAAQ